MYVALFGVLAVSFIIVYLFEMGNADLNTKDRTEFSKFIFEPF